MKELKPRDKVTQRMTRDGLVQDNQTTGESQSVSGRDAEQNLSPKEQPELMRRTEQLAHEAGITVNAVSLDEGVKSAAVSPFTVRVQGSAATVELLPEGTPVSFRVEEGYTLFQTRPLRIFDMYRITQT